MASPVEDKPVDMDAILQMSLDELRQEAEKRGKEVKGATKPQLQAVLLKDIMELKETSPKNRRRRLEAKS